MLLRDVLTLQVTVFTKRSVNIEAIERPITIKIETNINGPLGKIQRTICMAINWFKYIGKMSFPKKKKKELLKTCDK